MVNDVLWSKLCSLKRCLQRVEEKTPNKPEDFLSDIDAQDIVSLNLQRSVQLCVNISAHITSDLEMPPPLSMADSFDRLRQANILSEHTCLRMKKAVGFRNIAVHDYCSIDLDIVYSVCTKNLEDFKNFSREIMKWTDIGNV